MRTFLPMTPEETSGEQLDVILVTGDAYVDHPSWGVAAIGRRLQAHGYSVGVIAQPDWRRPDAFAALGRPRLFFGVTAGNMDTQVNKFTASRRLRNADAYSPGGQVGLRPDRATIPYVSRVRQACPGVPVVVVRGGDGELRAMHNVCRHRGAPVANGRGWRWPVSCSNLLICWCWTSLPTTWIYSQKTFSSKP